MKKLLISQFIVLLIGTVFAWTNFGLEFYAWLSSRSCPTGCSAGITNPFLTPCFYGAIFFTLAFILSITCLVKSKEK